MKNENVELFFQYLGIIWRDITAIEFLMRSAIAKFDKEEEKFPKGPYLKGKIYNIYPKSFGNLSFEMIVNKFNKRFSSSGVEVPIELVGIRDAMAHGLIAQVNDSPIEELIKFREKITDNNHSVLEVELSMSLDIKRLHGIAESTQNIRKSIVMLMK